MNRKVDVVLITSGNNKLWNYCDTARVLVN